MEAKDLLEMRLKKISNFCCSEDRKNKLTALNDLNEIFFKKTFESISLKGNK